MENQDNRPMIPHKTRIIILGAALFGFFGILLLIGIIPRIQQHKDLLAESKPTLPTVYTVSPSFNHKQPALNLPGEIRPFLTTSIYSRVSGTLKARYVDIGSRVSAGQLLALVEVPEQDQELEQAKATLAEAQQNVNQSRFNYEFAAKSYQRWKSTGKGGALSQQDIEQHENQFNTAQAAMRSAMDVVKNSEANVRRILALESYKHIIAPFSGVISEKNVDPGANIVAGGSSTSTNLFTIEQIDKLRVFINVPQPFVPIIRKGMPAKISIQEYKGKTFEGQVFSYSEMLDPASRTMLTQIILPNPSGKVYPGLYSNVSLNVDKKHAVMTIPDNTIMSTIKGLQVITVRPNHKLHYIPIKPGRDYGNEIEIQSGLTGNELLVENPSDSLREGQRVKVSAGKIEKQD